MDGYFRKLCEDVKIGNKDDEYNYVHLAKTLMQTPFTAIIEGDFNRIESAKVMRVEYFNEYHYTGPVSVFELLVSMCHELIFMSGVLSPEYSYPKTWFLLMISNLGLVYLTDDIWENSPSNAVEIVSDSIQKWMNREYDFDGSGGLFPLDNPRNDQANTELWYQMNAFLMQQLK